MSTVTGLAAEAVQPVEVAELVELAERFASRELEPRASYLDEDRTGERHRAWRALTELGLDRALAGEDEGGSALDPGAFCAILEELAAGEAGISLALLLHNAAAFAVQQAVSNRHVERIRTGERWTCMPPPLVGEPRGTDGAEVPPPNQRQPGRRASSLSARRLAKGWVIDGRLPALLGGADAAGIVAFAHVDDDNDIAVAVDSDSAAVELTPWCDQMGLRAAPAAEVVLRELTVSDDDVLSPEADTLAARVQWLILEGTAAIARGIARCAEQRARAYAEQRRQGGTYIADHDAVKLMLGSMSARRHGPRTVASAGLAEALAGKISATEAALATATDAVQVFGGAGYMVESGVEKALRDAKYCQLFPESNLLGYLQLSDLERRPRQ